jgi:hypothetical protein
MPIQSVPVFERAIGSQEAAASHRRAYARPPAVDHRLVLEEVLVKLDDLPFDERIARLHYAADDPVAQEYVRGVRERFRAQASELLQARRVAHPGASIVPMGTDFIRVTLPYEGPLYGRCGGDAIRYTGDGRLPGHVYVAARIVRTT